MMAALLRRLGLARRQDRPPASSSSDQIDDQTYSDAALDNAMHDTTRSLADLEMTARRSDRSNARLKNGIELLKISNGDPGEILADLVRGMKSSHRNH